MKEGRLENKPQLYAKIAGALLLISIFAGGFGELFVLSKIVVPGDPKATAENLVANDFLFRVGFASYLIEAVCDLTLILIFYLLLRPVSKVMAMLTVIFGLASTLTFAFAELFNFTSLLLLSRNYFESFSTGQINSLVMFLVDLYGYGGGLFMLFYGLATLLRGYLVFRSGFLPRILGVLMVLAGSCFVVRNFALVLAPAYASDFFLMPTGVAMTALSLWLIIKGVDVEKWNVISVQRIFEPRG